LGPGLPLYNPNVLFFIYLAILCYIFVGIAIISDVFMGAIEQITSETRHIKMTDENGQLVYKKVNVWNPTVANLTLMALGSSAPEILLSIIETVGTLGEKPGELGPSTIVGSAAYNLLAISAVCVYSVNTETDERDDKEIAEDGCVKGVHKIQDLGVFSITASWSCIAYLWLYYCLYDGEVDVLEAYLTFAFFWIMLGMAFAADRFNRNRMQKRLDKKFGHEVVSDTEKSAADLTMVTNSENKIEGSMPAFTALEAYNELAKDDQGHNVDATED
jgi:solute carrier family 8 (sodium/calcium exchanger)